MALREEYNCRNYLLCQKRGSFCLKLERVTGTTFSLRTWIFQSSRQTDPFVKHLRSRPHPAHCHVLKSAAAQRGRDAPSASPPQREPLSRWDRPRGAQFGPSDAQRSPPQPSPALLTRAGVQRLGPDQEGRTDGIQRKFLEVIARLLGEDFVDHESLVAPPACLGEPGLRRAVHGRPRGRGAARGCQGGGRPLMDGARSRPSSSCGRCPRARSALRSAGLCWAMLGYDGLCWARLGSAALPRLAAPLPRYITVPISISPRPF